MSYLFKRYWGKHFWTRGCFCATVGQTIEESLEYHFEPTPNDSFKLESGWTRRLGEAYPDVQSVIQSLRLFDFL